MKKSSLRNDESYDLRGETSSTFNYSIIQADLNKKDSFHDIKLAYAI